MPLEPLTFLVEGFMTDANGELFLPIWGGPNAPVTPWIFQAATYDMGAGFWDLSNGLQVSLGAF